MKHSSKRRKLKTPPTWQRLLCPSKLCEKNAFPVYSGRAAFFCWCVLLCVFFSPHLTSGQKEDPSNHCGSRDCLGLLGGSEPPTSSLPMIAPPIVACRLLLCFIFSIPCATGAMRFPLVVVCCALRLLYLKPSLNPFRSRHPWEILPTRAVPT